MPDNPTLQSSLDFLDGLAKNNDRAWFQAHRPDYQAARLPFERFVDGLIDEFRLADGLQALSARDCIPRIYRDIRFSHDKSPYKTNFAALIGPGGWKGSQGSHMGYYLSLEPHDRSMLAGGLYDPSSEQLEHFRAAIARNASAFKRITQAREFVAAFGEVQGDRLKTAPKGYDRAHPEIALLQLKQVTAYHHFTDREVLAGDFQPRVIAACRALRPFLDILEEMLV